MIKAIAMKCTQEQFELIKPKLEALDMINITSFSEYPYLCNNFNYKNKIGNVYKYSLSKKDYEVFETWNEKIFLEACGIQTEPTHTITKEQIRTIESDGCSYVKEWFPKAFEVELKVGTWYKHTEHDSLIVFNNGDKTLGFWKGEYIDSLWFDKNGYIAKHVTEATEKEIFEALKNEAVKRGFVEGAQFYGCDGHLKNKPIEVKEIKFGCVSKGFCEENIGLYCSDSWIFRAGKWATIIQPKQMSQSDIEKELGYKIKIV